jgi:YgiT-type zinc finger domain-containing protein
MKSSDLRTRWRAPSDDAIADVAAWRDQHPQATFQEIESAIDDRLARLRAHMLEDAVSVSAVADLRDAPEVRRPLCPACGTRVRHKTRDKRTLITQHGQTVTLERSYAVCPKCGEAFFPPR